MKKFSFIIPTFNSIRWINNCVDSILNQNLDDFNLIIIDSGSTDETIIYIESLNDERIIIYKTEIRLGILENWQRITSVPKNEFITIVGHDDVFKSNYLYAINNLINNYPNAGLYQTHFSFIDGNNAIIRKCLDMDTVIKPDVLFLKVLNNTIEITATGFMVRSSDYDSIGGIPAYPNLLYADIELWLTLILDSYLVVSKENCFFFRFHVENTSKSPGKERILAFEKMIDFLIKLKKTKIYAVILDRHAADFLKSYVIGACHKLLYVPKNNRNSVEIQDILTSARKCAKKLIPTFQFVPEKYLTIKLAIFIDKFEFLRKVFLFYKSFKKRTF